jgi:hypothetical protein
MKANQPRDLSTMAGAMYPSVGRQQQGKKWEPTGVAFSPKLAAQMGKGQGPGPYDKAPPELELVNWNEPPASSLTDYAAALHLGDYRVERPAEFEEAQKAMLALGFGITAARAALAFAKRVAKYGYPPHDSASARAALEEDWGEKTDGNLAEVKALVSAGKQHYPGLGTWLTSESGLGNDPQFIAFLHKAAQRRKERGHG